jgi:hypothetical protein
MEEQKNDLVQTQDEINTTPIVPTNTAQVVQYRSMWNSEDDLKSAWRSAQYLAKTDLAPERTDKSGNNIGFKNKPENCLVAIDVANRTGFSPLVVMQHLYVVKGIPAWSGQMVIAIVNSCGLFTPLEFIFVGEKGNDNYGCYARAFRILNNEELTSPIIDIKMSKNEGWYEKTGSKWKTMPEQMMKYRAASFFGRTYCPERLLGLQTTDEVKDTSKNNDEEETEIITITMPKKPKN